MSGSSSPAGLSACGCGQGTSVLTPAAALNAPGLPAIAYRAGTHSTFKASMLARLSQLVGGLAARSDDDLSIALLDAWAVVADVLTFYQERIANECCIGTAVDLTSLRMLARLIGYVPRPAIAASTHLAFTLVDAPGAQTASTIPAGTRVQSIPGDGQHPQTFETIADAPCSPRWNAMRPALTVRQPLTADLDSIVLAGINTGLRRGDGLLLVLDDLSKAFHRVDALETDRASGTTTVAFEPPASGSPVETPALRERSRGFAAETPFSRSAMTDQASAEYMASDLGIDFIDYVVSLQDMPPAVPSDIGAYALRTRASLFGHNAPDWNALSDEVHAHYTGGSASDWPFVTGDGTLVLDGVYSKLATGSYVVVVKPDGDPVYGLVTAANETGASGYALSAKVTSLVLEVDGGDPLPSNMTDLRTTTVYAQTDARDFLTLARLPKYPDHKLAGITIELDGLYPGLKAGQALAFTGTRFGPSGGQASEIAIIDPVQGPTIDPNTLRTTIVLQSPLSTEFVAETVEIDGNVAPATHGESKDETLGSGDASASYQTFSLKQAPLTYVSSLSGASSTLIVRVNGQEWHEVATLYDASAQDRVFVTSLDETGAATIEFGDGQSGARPQTGMGNITAWYRQGAGASGNLKAGQLSLLMTRPLGVTSVTNPADTSGGADGEKPGDIRASAPLTVRTLDRIVSLQDYGDYAAAFPGIAKALATWTWSGRRQGVFITVAGPSGAAIDPGAPGDTADVYGNLLAALSAAGDPTVSVIVASYRRRTFAATVRVAVDPDFEKPAVFAAVESALANTYSFDNRTFGQPVFLSDVMTTAQNVTGVVAVVVDALYRLDRSDAAGSAQDVLWAAVPAPGADATVPIDPAELLTIGIVNVLEMA